MIDGTGRVHCCRCGLPSPLVLEAADGGGDPSVLPLIVPPPGYIGATDADEDEDGIVCGECASTEEVADYMAELAATEGQLELHAAIAELVAGRLSPEELEEVIDRVKPERSGGEGSCSCPVALRGEGPHCQWCGKSTPEPWW